MGKAQISDILILAFISGVTALLTSTMGISGTVLGAVVSSIAAELLKTFFKDPVQDKISEHEKSNMNSSYYDSPEDEYGGYGINNNFSYESTYAKQEDSSHISTKALFLFPLIVILIIEIIHFLGAINILPNTFVYNLESITNWTLFRTIGYALIIMGLYPIFSKKLSTHHGAILIIVGIIELIIGYADTNTHALMLFSVFSSLQDYVNILIILAILYTVLTIPDEIKEDSKKHYFSKNHQRKNNSKFKKANKKNNPNNRFDNNKFKQNKYNKRHDGNGKNKDDDEGYYFYYEE